jgi:hypothetical protein
MIIIVGAKDEVCEVDMICLYAHGITNMDFLKL